MNGETDLAKLLATLEPVRQPGEFVFCAVENGLVPRHIKPLLLFEESEAVTLVVERELAAKTGLDGVFPCAWITLTVHSSLDAVGLLAAVSGRLAEHGIPCNVVSAFHHDHLFVPVDRADETTRILSALSSLPAEAKSNREVS